MATVREATSSNANIESQWECSMSPLKRELTELFSRVKVNEKYASPFELKDIDADIKTLHQFVIHRYGCDMELT